MPPPNRPLADIFVSGRPQRSDYRVLTPRTPHSRSGRAEEGLTEVELELRRYGDDQDGRYLTSSLQQSVALLTSSSQPIPPAGYRSRGDDHDILVDQTGWKIVQVLIQKSLLISSSFVACGLLAMFMMSLRKPGILEDAIGVAPSSQSTLSLPTSQKDVVATPTPSFVDTSPPDGRVISYENYTHFPLSGPEYRHECEKLMGGFMHHEGYWVPPRTGALDVVHHDDVTNYHMPEGGLTKVCSKTITYMLDGHVGLAADLALMAQVPGLARERNRTFLVDDTYWNRGKWTDHFQDVRSRQPGPEPGCRAPPPKELVACPREARHGQVVSSKTAKYHLGHEYAEQYEDPYGHGLHRQKPIFDRALQSLTETIRPNGHSAALIRAARSEIASILSLPEAVHSNGNPDPYISVHIRRGDRKAESWAFHNSYVPLGNYVQATRDTWERLYINSTSPTSASDPAPTSAPNHFPAPPITYVASDSPDALRDFLAAFPSSTAVFALDLSTDPDLRGLAPQREYVQEEFEMEEEDERIRLTRGMIVDLAIMSGLWAWEGEVVPGAVICTISSNACKLSAVGLGWDRAFGFGDNGDYSRGDINQAQKRWVEIDNRDAVSPAWRGFDLSH
ncbi:hypothetical protein AcW1_000984 [Taiwanofungus camphoratus]|nr:hypothetical protein AcW1_000984 [Antrodia cinnamomea]